MAKLTNITVFPYLTGSVTMEFTLEEAIRLRQKLDGVHWANEIVKEMDSRDIPCLVGKEGFTSRSIKLASEFANKILLTHASPVSIEFE
jgi:hypothetical protein